MAVRCRIISGKSFCVNYLLSSSRCNNFLDSAKFYHQSNDNHTCNVRKNVIIAPFCEKVEQHAQLPVIFSPCTTPKTLQQLHLSKIISGRFSSHVLMNQNNPITSKVEKQSVLLSDVVNIEETKKASAPASSEVPSGRPSEEQVKKMFDWLSQTLPLIFLTSVDYENFAGDVVIENNLQPVTRRSVGLVSLIKGLSYLRIYVHFKFAYVKFHVLKITSHPEEGCVKVRWRVTGITTYKAFFKFWRLKLWKLKETLAKEEEIWYDGFSIFTVNSDGKIAKITIDKMMPDEENKLAKNDKMPLAARLAMVGIAPESLNSLVLCKWSSPVETIDSSKNVLLSHHSFTKNILLSSDHVQ